MPPLTRWYIRTGLLYLLLGFTIGALLLAHKGVPFLPALWLWLPAHFELLLVGWIVQLTFGVAFWIMPRFWKPPRRGNERAAELAYILLNIGIWLVVLATVLRLSAGWLVAGRVVQISAAVSFALSLWPRIVSREG